MTPNYLLAPSSSFKKEATKSLAAILVFITVYLLLMTASVALVIGSFYAAIGIVSLRLSLYTILAGFGIIGAGIMVFVFLVKFMFSTSREDNGNSVEITENDHPKLFATIREIADQTGTRRPKKVFLSPDVNACVFYHSSFWSMFLPVQKNLKIGLGLVNALNTSELKAVIAHEFGHFSQRSMRLGSWVYQVNKIIYDMLFHNKGYAESLNSMGNVHGIFSIFASITIGIVRAIQWVLRQVFKLVNKSYLGLSRQMEFHADLVASSICGSNNVVSALRRIDFAGDCYQSTVHLCNTALKRKKSFADFYASHSKVQQHLAMVNGFITVDGLVQPQQAGGTANRINFKDQWASHPTLQEREDYLQPFNLKAPADVTPAWQLFANVPEWKQRMTEALYSSVPQDEKKEKMGEPDFEQLLEEQLKSCTYPRMFGDFYNGRAIADFDANEVAAEACTIRPIARWFGDEEKGMPKKMQLLEQDIAVLDAIGKKTIDTSSFDFDGKKYNRSKAVEIMVQLEIEKKGLQKRLLALDRQIFRHAYALAPLHEAEALKEDYIAYFNLRNESESFFTIADKMMNVLAPVFQGQTIQVAEINAMIRELKSGHEPGFKAALEHWEARGVFENDATLKETINAYRSARWEYFFDGSFIDAELIGLSTIVQESWARINRYLLSVFKGITEKQALYFESKSEVVSE